MNAIYAKPPRPARDSLYDEANPTLHFAEQAMSRLTRSVRGGWAIPVPWESAGVLQRRLTRMGLSSTLRLDLTRREAFLELAPGVAPAKALLALIGFSARSRTRPKAA